MRLLHAATAAGTTHTDSTDEAALASYAFPANFWQVGKVVRAKAAIVVADNNSTDTLTLKTRFGASALAGTAVATSGAIDAVDGDLSVVDIEITCRAVGAAGSFAVSVLQADPDAAGISVEAYFAVVTAIDTTAATYVAVTADWSVAHADNQVAAQSWTVIELA